MILPKIKKKKIELWQLNCQNWRIKKKKKNCSKSNAMATHYFTIFFTNCCCDQLFIGSRLGPSIISLFCILIITHHINNL